MPDGYVTVIAPIDGSPAAAADLQSGDVILKLDNVPVKGLSLGEAIEKMRGPKGSKIELTVGRPGTSQPFTVTLTRDTIKMASVRERMLEPGYGYIRIAQFQLGTGEDVARALEKLQAKGPLKGLVLDLRNNPGGVLSASVEVAGLFLDGGTGVYTEGRMPNSDMNFDAEPGDTSDNKPLVVLINAGSASASEIVAGALQDRGRAVVMGSDSFGKGSVQSLIPLDRTGTTALKLTTARYYTPSGKSVQEGGIAPDIRVPQLSDPDFALREKYQTRESDLRGHLINELGIADEEMEQDRIADPRFQLNSDQLEEQGIEDFQLHYALETLRRTTASSVALRNVGSGRSRN